MPDRRKAPRRRCAGRRCGDCPPFRVPPGQVGFRQTMDSDPSLGFSRMARQSSQVAMNLRSAAKFALIRFAETATRAHSASKGDMAQRAEVGPRPCWTLATRVALPPTSAPGNFNPKKARGLELWETFGPRPPLHLTACQNARICGSLSDPAVPDLFVRSRPPANSLRANVVTAFPSPKPSPPALRMGNPNEPANPAAPKPKFPSPLPPPVTWPSEPSAANLSESTSLPTRGVSATQPQQGPPHDRIRLPRKDRAQSGMFPNALHVEDGEMSPHEQSL